MDALSAELWVISAGAKTGTGHSADEADVAPLMAIGVVAGDSAKTKNTPYGTHIPSTIRTCTTTSGLRIWHMVSGR